jgi:pSer/pThr/pTyr-binding forkhead associated (FHA) protein
VAPDWIPFLALGILALIALLMMLRRPRPQPRKGAHLQFIYGPLDGKAFDLADEITTVGSGNVNHVVVADPDVARKHIAIRRDPETGAYELADLGSVSGVHVNGHRLAKRLLVAGDIIRIGASEMVFHLEKTR